MRRSPRAAIAWANIPRKLSLSFAARTRRERAIDRAARGDAVRCGGRSERESLERGARTVHELDEVAVDELLVLPAEQLLDGVPAEEDLAGRGEDEDDGLAELRDEEVGPALALHELERGGLLEGRGWWLVLLRLAR